MGRVLLLTEGSKKGKKIPLLGTTKNVTLTGVNTAPGEIMAGKPGSLTFGCHSFDSLVTSGK